MVSVGTPEVVKTNRVWSPNIIGNLHVKRSHTHTHTHYNKTRIDYSFKYIFLIIHVVCTIKSEDQL